MNNWRIPEDLETKIRKRDDKCVYCRAIFSKTNQPTWEHIINDARIITLENIALSCKGCNSSKGQKLLKIWIDSEYCKKKNISYNTVADVIKDALRKKE